MKSNRSFLIDTILTITLLVSTAMLAQAQEVTDYIRDHHSESHGEVVASTTTDNNSLERISENSVSEFSSEYSPTARELAVAILIIAVCQLVQYSYQSQSQSWKQETSRQLARLEHHYLLIGLGLGSFYQSVKGNGQSHREISTNLKVPKRKRIAQSRIGRDLRYRS